MKDDEMTAEVDLALAIKEIEELKLLHAANAKKISELEGWKETCSRWAAWWAGVCAAVMTAATLIRTYWDDIGAYFRGIK